MSRNPSRLPPALALLLVALPCLADPPGIPPSQLPERTRPQFEALAKGAKDPTMLKTVGLIQKLFVDAVNDPKRVPESTRFSEGDVQKVGEQIHSLIGGVYDYQQSERKAQALENRGFYAEAKAVRVDATVKLVNTVNAADILPKMGLPTHTAQAVQTETEHSYADAHASPQEHQFPEMAHTENAYRADGKFHELPDGPPSGSSELLCSIIKDVVSRAQKPPTPEPAPAPVSPEPAPAPAPAPAPLPQGTGATSNAPAGPTGITPIRVALGVSNPNSPSDAMLDARERYNGGDIYGGLADASRAIQLGGGAPAYAMRGGMELDQKDYAKASSDASSALQLDANNREALAVSHLAKVEAPSVALPGGPARSNEQGESVPGASAASAAAAALAATRASGMSGEQAKKEAQNAMRLGDLAGARVYVDRALSQNPNNPDLLNVRASIRARQHDYEGAISDARAGLALAPKNKTLLKTLGYAQLRGKHYKDAEATAGEMLSIDPGNSYAFALRAHAEGNLGDKDAMMADINHAAALDPAYKAAAADLAKLVQVPTDSDTLFLFPGEPAPAAKTAAPSAPERGRTFSLLVGAAIAGGLLLALGLMKTVMAPLTEKVTSAFTRRSGPATVPLTDDGRPSVNGLLPGLIRGQYQISRQIGAGGMGMVYEGTDRSLGRRVAIKKMRDELRVNPQERARFVIEAKTVAALHHPNVVDIYAIAEEGSDVFLIFEYVDGKTVHELVQLNGRLPLKQAASVVRSVAGALDYAHAHNVIHRDMKPSNVMIDANGRVKVMDFGIARMAKDSMTRFSMTATVVGTPPYMAPEQEQGHVRRESDVYALAVCAYEMLTGKLPFIGIGAGMLMNKINMSFVAPSRATAGVPEALDEVFAKAFQADPDQRYRTPKEFADALEASLGSAVKA